MPSLILEDVTVDFPIYGAQKSFRTELFDLATGGLIRREGKHRSRVTVRAIDGLNLRIEHGDRLALIGHNGAGKSTLLRVLAGVFEPTGGRITIEGRLSPLFNLSPGLDVDDTGYENVMNCGLFLGMDAPEVRRKLPQIAAATGLGDFLALPVRTYSAGMIPAPRLCHRHRDRPGNPAARRRTGRRRRQLCRKRGAPHRRSDRPIEHRRLCLACARTVAHDLQQGDFDGEGSRQTCRLGNRGDRRLHPLTTPRLTPPRSTMRHSLAGLPGGNSR